MKEQSVWIEATMIRHALVLQQRSRHEEREHEKNTICDTGKSERDCPGVPHPLSHL